MDFNKFAKVTDSIQNKRSVTVEGRSVVAERNPLDALEDRDKITDSTQKVIIVDEVLIKKLSKASRESKRKFLARLSDAQRRRVLSQLKKIKDSRFSESLGYILLDDLLANVVTDPSNTNIKNLDDFLNTQEYCEFSDRIKNLVSQVKNADTNLDEAAVNELVQSLGDRESHLAAVIGTKEDEEETFELPDEEELTEEDENYLSDAARKHVRQFGISNSIKEIIDVAEDVIAEMQGKNRSYKDASTTYWKAFDEAWSSQYGGQEFVTNNQIKDALEAAVAIVDETEALDSIFDNPAIDNNGDEIKDVDETSVVALLTEALESYAAGDSDKLDALMQQSLSTEVPVDSETESVQEDEPEEEEDVEEPTEETSEEELKDSIIHFARRFKAGLSVNKLTDALKKRVKVLDEYNFYKSQTPVMHQELPEETTVINMPLSREEYYSMHKPGITPLMQEYLEEVSNGVKLPMVIETCEYDNGMANVNNGQYYIPYNCTSEEFEKRLNEAEKENLQEIIASCTVPLEDALKAAAKCDNLSFIDTGFYKSTMGAPDWKFDSANKPACLGNCPDGSSIRRCTEQEANYHLFGVPYIIS